MKRDSVNSDPWAMGWMIKTLVLITFFMAFTVPMKIIHIIAAVEREGEAPVRDSSPFTISLATAESANATATAVAVTPTPHIPHLGIIAGHAGSDSGAICPDGLQEVEITTDIARRVVALLEQHGWQVDLLEEFDVRLNGYQADALLSIHADSCGFPGKSGFKVARAESSYLPEPEDQLVDCISEYYEERTGLEFDPYTITFDMTRYHAYYEINSGTPAAIIEAGFMLDDRDLLTEHSDTLAQGIVDGLVCFIEGQTP
jgi:N-acetylmuramoyl-L-alanine amidase